MTDDQVNELPLETDLEVIRWMLGQLQPGDELDEFVNGLKRFAGRPVDAASTEEWNRWWASWVISLRLDQDHDYSPEVKDALVRLGADNFGARGGREEIERLLSA